MLPRDFPPPSTVQRYLREWRDDGLMRRINSRLVAEVREQEGRQASSTAGVIDRCRNCQAAPDGEVGRLSPG